MKRNDFGWNNTIAKLAKPYLERTGGQTICRVTSEFRGLYKMISEHGETLAEISGRMRHLALDRQDLPVVGDWVLADVRQSDGKATIHHLLPRFSKFSRNMAGRTTDEQIVAANMDTVFLVMALNHDFNVRRLERYLMMAWDSGANPVIVLTKSDLCDNIDEKIDTVQRIAFGVPVHPVSAIKNQGKESMTAYLGPGRTAVLLGSSGAGKSTLINWVLGSKRQTVNSVREGDDRGRHTTTNRELIVIPVGGVIIDTPGMRELQLWTASDDAARQNFADIETLAAGCRFNDCTHTHEPGCAVQAAIADGTLEQARLDSYHKLQRELDFVKRKTDKQAQRKEKAKWRQISKTMKHKK